MNTETEVEEVLDVVVTTPQKEEDFYLDFSAWCFLNRHLDYSKIGVSFASTSSTISAGMLSTLRALREPKSRARGWSHRTTPVVFVPAPVKDTVKPAVRAKLPPLVIGNTTGVFVSRLKAEADTTSTGRVPCCS